MNFLCLSTLFSLTATGLCADPTEPTLPTEAPTNNAVPKVKDAGVNKIMGDFFRKGDKKGPARIIKDVTLDYEGATAYSNEVLSSQVTLKLTQVSFLSALDAVLDASAKTCRVECRSISPARVSISVKDAPVGRLLDSIAKLGSARLYVLPTKLIIAPESALSSDEKKEAKPYRVLLSSTTLPKVVGSEVLALPNKDGRSILDLANTPISARIQDRSIAALTTYIQLKEAAHLDEKYMEQFQVEVIGPIPLEDYLAHVSMKLKDVKYGDALASIAQLMGCELYMTPTHFVICPANKFPEGKTPELRGQPLFAVFAPPTVSFLDPSAGKS